MQAAPFHANIAEAPAGADAFFVETSDGLRIRTVHWTGGTKGTAFIFSGRSEYAEKYGRIVGRLLERGFTVVAFDWRGQGLSSRPHTATLGHVGDFRDYQKDWRAVLAGAEAAALPRPYAMFAHSMGGCIGLRTLVETDTFCSAIMSAPMWHLQMGAATRQIAASLGQIANLVGLNTRRTPGTSRGPSALTLPFENNVLTSDAEHFAWFRRQLTAHPELGLGGPSVQWTCAALEETARLYLEPLPRCPVLAFLGTEEHVVSSTVIRIQMGKMPAGELVTLQGARHEIWMERADILEQVWPAIDRFIDRTLGPSPPGAAPKSAR